MTKPMTAKQRNNRRAMARIVARLRAANIAEVESLMTPKQRVVAKYPGAVCEYWTVLANYAVHVQMALPQSFRWTHIGSGNTPKAAWANAAANLSKGQK